MNPNDPDYCNFNPCSEQPTTRSPGDDFGGAEMAVLLIFAAMMVCCVYILARIFGAISGKAAQVADIIDDRHNQIER